MRKEDNHLWECFVWLSYAVLLSICLNALKLSVSYFRIKDELTKMRKVSRNLAPPLGLGEDWIERYTLVQHEFLARVTAVQKDESVYDLHLFLVADDWRLKENDFVETVLRWLWGSNFSLLMTTIDALIFVGSRNEIPGELVSSTIHRVLFHTYGKDYAVKCPFDSRWVQEQLEQLGLLCSVKGCDTYYTSTLIHKRPVRSLEWHKSYLQDLRSDHPSYASLHLIQLLVKSRLYQDAIEILEEERFCALRVNFLKHEAANRHVNDCLLLFQAMQTAILPAPNLERACLRMAKEVNDGASYLVLGKFLRHQGLQSSTNLLIAAQATAIQGMQSELLHLSKSFKRVATIYLSNELENESTQYKIASRALCCNRGDYDAVLSSIKTHTHLEARRSISSPAVEHQVERLEARLEEMAKKYVCVSRQACQELGDRETAAILGKILDAIRQRPQETADPAKQVYQPGWTKLNLKFVAYALSKEKGE